MDKYDVAIIGAGIAGSTLAILLAQAGKNVIIFEKNTLPAHKVCGEFVSMETYGFFESIGIPLGDWDLPIIKKLKLTSQKGTVLEQKLNRGGFGISRYKLDFELCQHMLSSGVQVCTNEKVISVSSDSVKTHQREITAQFIVGSHGKYTPSYISRTTSKSPSKKFVGIKYHIKGEFEKDLISLHSFEGGYCGMSKIEDDLFCMCYLIDAKMLRDNQNNIHLLEQNVLSKNKYLRYVFSRATHVWEKPAITSNIQFDKNQIAQNDVLLCGDAAGSISPLSGNGMSIAVKTGLLLSQLILSGQDKKSIAIAYERNWDRLFNPKIKKAKVLNYVMLKPVLHDLILKVLKTIRPLRLKTVNDMQGDPFVRDTDLIR